MIFLSLDQNNSKSALNNTRSCKFLNSKFRLPKSFEFEELWWTYSICKLHFLLKYCQLGLWPVSYLLRMECRNSMMFLEDLVFFQSISLPSELFLPIAFLEVNGGLAILLGVLTRIASLLFIIEMTGAIVFAKLSKGFVGGYEFELLLISICITLALVGPGMVSIENYILKREIFPRGKQLRQALLHSWKK